MALVVDGGAFPVLGGELGNSIAADRPAMRKLWADLKVAGLNTVLLPAYWEQLEPEEGRFDFSWIDEDVKAARREGLKIVFLWFGTWKNSMSCYAPAWVKLDQARFPRMMDEKGNKQDVLSAHGEETLAADIRAFKALMARIARIDAGRGTVLMVQVENEMGSIPCARDHSPLADKAWREPLPQAVRAFLGTRRHASTWADAARSLKGARLAAVEEMFTAWHLARYAEAVAKAGKEVHPLPLFVNAALPREGDLPGQYPSGGPLPHLAGIWKLAAPSIDMLCPDIYGPDFEARCGDYAVAGNPLFIPEHRCDASVGAKALYAFGEKAAIGFSPFAIEKASPAAAEALKGAYALIDEISPLLDPAEGRIEEPPRAALALGGKKEYRLEFDGIVARVGHERTLPWNAEAAQGEWPAAAVIVLRTGPMEFIVAGTGAYVEFATPRGKPFALLGVDRGRIQDGEFVPVHRLNGDETHQGRHVRTPTGSYWIQRARIYPL